MQSTADLSSLIVIDRALASPEGLNKPKMAAQLGKSTKYVQRYMAILESIGAEIVTELHGTNMQPGSYWTHRYADRRKRVFSRWVDSEQRG